MFFAVNLSKLSLTPIFSSRPESLRGFDLLDHRINLIRLGFIFFVDSCQGQFLPALVGVLSTIFHIFWIWGILIGFFAAAEAYDCNDEDEEYECSRNCSNSDPDIAQYQPSPTVLTLSFFFIVNFPIFTLTSICRYLPIAVIYFVAVYHTTALFARPVKPQPAFALVGLNPILSGIWDQLAVHLTLLLVFIPFEIIHTFACDVCGVLRQGIWHVWAIFGALGYLRSPVIVDRTCAVGGVCKVVCLQLRGFVAIYNTAASVPDVVLFALTDTAETVDPIKCIFNSCAIYHTSTDLLLYRVIVSRLA